jgi:hypothetical protein
VPVTDRIPTYQGRGVVSTGRSLAAGILVTALAPCWGCGLGARDFRKIQHPAPLVRARAVGNGDSRPSSQVVPALIGRLEDPDPVVRLAAHEELRRRTGRDFGFVPWAGSEERAGAITRWRTWLLGPAMPAESVGPTRVQPPPKKTLPSAQTDAIRSTVP